MDSKPGSIYPALQQDVTPTACGSKICSYSYHSGRDGPILILIHGYPQSACMWRYLIQELVPRHSIFVPELPGYGVSTLPSSGQHSKRSVGRSILEAFSSVFKIAQTDASPREIILIGHDRGARISHRLAVDGPDDQHLKIVSIILMDIVPTKVQWETMSKPEAAAAYFHWSFLANVVQAANMIEAYGGDNWCRDILKRGIGSSSQGQAFFNAEDAPEVYASNFKERDAIVGSNEDYASGGVLEVTEQSEDMEAGRKINVPTLILFSEEKLGKTHDVAGTWKDWIGEGVLYQAKGIGAGRGHYLPEEAPVQVGRLVLEWLQAGRVE